MKLLIVGLGSMGKRRARLAKGIDASIELCGVDLSEERRTGEEVRRLGIDAYPDIPSAVAARHPEDIVIGCDTVVDYAGRVFGKPKDHEDALRMLRALSGAQHHVHTGVCIAFPGGEERFTVTTKVKFYPIEEAQLEAYAATGEPYDKAGAYAIQGGAAAFCEGLEGCYYNVMGFPVSRVARALAKIVEKI